MQKNHCTKKKRVALCKKTARKNTKYSRNEATLKIDHLPKAIALAKAIAHAKCLASVKNLKCEKDAKNNFTRIAELLCRKNRSKTNAKYSRNETILKIGHLAKAIAHARP